MPKGQPNDAARYAIHRLRYGWVVRLVRGGRRLEKSFSDRAHGGQETALVFAQGWRDEMLRMHQPAPRRQLAAKPRSNGGPMPGVTRELDARGKVRLWRAKTYVGAGLILQKTFSVARWGRTAKAMAVEERQAQLLSVTGLRRVHPAEQKLRGAPRRRDALPALPPPVAAARIVRSTNQSGYSGVVMRVGPDGRPRHWTAQTTVGGRWVSRSFSIEKLGEPVALLLAIWAREDQLADVNR